MVIDRIAKIALRRRGIGVREKIVRYRGQSVLFRLNGETYDVYTNEEKIASLETNNINEAIQLYKTLEAKH
ncbi:hypothetical protein BH713_14265 [Enterobacter kobei]|uniref:Uncharacterized protein n=1 Tax=Enterobacter kobei TaxID=208224 RepID=A0ACC8S2F0_9ENTR|nr:hypothetical protein BH713_14265 [Enterobacter kobei]